MSTAQALVTVITWVGCLWSGCLIAVVLACAPTLRRLWRDPVFSRPVLVIESDDWGAGPLAQAEALDRLTTLLQSHRDGAGQFAKMSLALVLSVPDRSPDETFRRLELDDPRLKPVLEAIQRGRDAGVLHAQLHGMEHFWPAALMASKDPAVRAWLHQPGPSATEVLPSALQSRWVDARTLPSRDLPAEAIRVAATEEVDAYRRILGELPPCVVPPTFVWTRSVEAAWAAAGVTAIVTPGVRYTRREADGRSGGIEGPFFNGQRDGAMIYSVRTDYFEPRKGRDAAYALAALERDAALGRPCVLENHRDNFCGDPALRDRSEAELERLLADALARHPQLRILSTASLFAILRERDPHWIIDGWRSRLPVFWRRVQCSRRLWTVMRITALAAVGSVTVALLTPRGNALPTWQGAPP